MERKYFLIPSCNYGGMSVITEAVIWYAKDKYTNVVVREPMLQSVMDDLISYADNLKKEKPRAKVPDIMLSLNPERNSIGWLFVGGWAITLHQVKNEI